MNTSATTPPEGGLRSPEASPRLPDYAGACVANIVPSLLGPRGTSGLPAYFPDVARGARQVVLLVVDGLGWHQLQRRLAADRNIAPTLAAMQGGAITTIAPTTTVTALTSITTGATPGEHGLVGYRIDFAGHVVQMLKWADSRGDARKRLAPRDVQPCPPFLGGSVPVLSKADFDGTAFTESHLRDQRMLSWRAVSSMVVDVRTMLHAGEKFVYCYYDCVDKIAHERGFGDYYDSELRTTDRLIADLASVLPRDAVLLVTADHGQVMVGDNTRPLHPDITRLVTHQSGEGRFRWLHSKGGRIEDIVSAVRLHHGDDAWVMTRDEMIDGGYFGPRVTDVVRRRLGDVAVMARTDVSFDDPADKTYFALQCRHGSLTSEEVDVPLLAVAGR
ncbi:MAG: alkaline phosphatase family protein [Actinomycetota bacterium]